MMIIKREIKTLFLILICAYAFFSVVSSASAILPSYSCLGPGTDFNATRADPTYYDPDPAPKINQFFCSIVSGGNQNGDTYFTTPGVNYACKEGFNQTFPDNLKCTRCVSYDGSGCTVYDTADYYTCSYLGAGPYKGTTFYQGYVYDNCTPSIVAPTITLTATPASFTSPGSSTLSWGSTNATSCSASWTSSTATSGSQSVSPSVTTIYSITCTGPGGSATQSIIVTVTDLPPIISNGAPTGIITAVGGPTIAVTLSVRTNEQAYCSYNQSADADFSTMSTTNGIMDTDTALQNHTVSVDLAIGNTYIFYVRCQDDPGGNENTSGYLISFSIANPPNALPVASFIANPLSGDAPLSVAVSSAGSYDPDMKANDPPLRYVWQWGDGTPDGAGATASHTYDTPGTYILRLTARDNQNGEGSSDKTIIVSAPPRTYEVSTTGICAPFCTVATQDIDCPGGICGPNGICVANGTAGAGPLRDQGAFSLDGAEWLSGTPPGSSPANFPAGTQSVVMRVHTSTSTDEDLNAECQYSTEPNTPYGNTVYMKQFTNTGSATSTVTLAVPKTSIAARAEQTYNYYIRCKDTQTGVVNNTDYWLSFTIGGPTLVSGPADYICRINQNFIKSGIPYLFDICKPE